MEVSKDTGSSYEDSLESDSSISESDISDKSEKDTLSKTLPKTVGPFDDGQEIDIIETEMVDDFRTDEPELRAEREKAEKKLKPKAGGSVDVAQTDDCEVDNTKPVKTKFIYKDKDTVQEGTVSDIDLKTETEDIKLDEVGFDQTKDSRHEDVFSTKTADDVDSALNILLNAPENYPERCGI